MIDIDYIKSVINPKYEDERKIGTEDIINFEVVEILRSGLISQVPKCFKCVENSGQKFKVLSTCNKCKNEEVLSEFSKTKLLQYLHPKYYQEIEKNILCPKCYELRKAEEEVLKKQQEEEHIKFEERRKEIIESNTNYFIENFLDHNCSWNQGVTLQAKVKYIIYRDYLIDDEVVCKAINNMTYKEFLETPYWSAISLYAKSRVKFKCQLCNCGDDLNTHHKTYERHGYEHFPDVIKSDLIVLCQDCHSKFHE